MENINNPPLTIPVHKLESPVRLTFFKQITEDIKTALERDPAARNRLEVFLNYAGLHAIWGHRVAHWLWTHKHYLLARTLAQVVRHRTGIEIHPAATIGRRFFIDHGMGVVIGETAEIRDDVTLYHGVTLGGVSLEKGKRHPTLESGVVVGAGAKVLGDITIGQGSRIGANTVVVKAVPANSVVVGVPGQIIRRRKDRDGKTLDLNHGNIPDAIHDCVEDLVKRVNELERKLEIKDNSPAMIQLTEDGTWQQQYDEFSI